MSNPIAPPEDVPPPSPESPEEKQKRIKWWKEARFGMFIHYGLYSGLEGDWQGKAVDSTNVEWLQKKAGLDAITYKNMALPKFCPSAVAVSSWVALAKSAGAEYVVLTTKHHEGFALFDSKYSDFTSKKLFDRDLVQEFFAECKKQGLKFGVYHSLPDWQHPDFDFTQCEGTDMSYPTGEIERNGGRKRDHSKYIEYLHNQVHELFDYGVFDLMWFDFSVPQFDGEKAWKARELMDWIRKKNPNIMINNRLYRRQGAGSVLSPEEGQEMDPRYGDFMTPEKFVPSTGLPGVDWEVAQTLNRTWGYSRFDNDYKTTQQLIQSMCEIVSKDGNFLLNIGPKGDGSLDEYTVDRMESIGKWLSINSAAIKKSTQSPLEETFSWGVITCNESSIHLCIFEIPESKTIVLPAASIGSIKNAAVLGSNGAVKIGATNEEITIYIPEDLVLDPVAVIMLEKSE